MHVYRHTARRGCYNIYYIKTDSLNELKEIMYEIEQKKTQFALVYLNVYRLDCMFCEERK